MRGARPRARPSGQRADPESLSREVAPRTSSTARRRHGEGVREQRDHRPVRPAVVGAAVTRTRRASPRQPTTAFVGPGAARARAGARPQALAAASSSSSRLELLIEQTLVHLEGGAEPLGELPPRALEAVICAWRAPSAARAASMVFSARSSASRTMQRRLAPGALLHLLDDPLGRDERLLQDALALLEPARALLEGLELLLEERVLLQQGLVVARRDPRGTCPLPGRRSRGTSSP